MRKRRVLTGYRPTGRLTLGHWFGNLMNMREMQDQYEAYYFVADWHALTSDWQDTSAVRRFTEEMVLDWLAAGIDPDKATIYRQSDVPEVAELTLYLSMVTPMSWLERVPSYKEQREQISDKDLGNVGFFLYPLMQAADITIVKADLVPVGEDQAPHLELTREIVRRFNGTYGELLVEPQAVIPKEGARVPGTDGRKMSKSYGNAIYLSESAEETAAKVRGMVTDPARKLKTDPGNPDICPLHQIHRLVGDPSVVAEFDRCCRVAECGCVAHKARMAEDLNAYLSEFRARRAELAQKRDLAWDVLFAGAERIRPAIDELMGAVREAMHVDAPSSR
ncbi:tryptophan--tRNA ligase [Coriobacteriia bacterium Es71-Z0120]|jgi:tryptophanyl-tRNA synthetase|uniref:tryptophan--tRNA ligase n=1 Tax=Parvivirga hydrogeniphila TaxID=2939460 RepID=UPI0022608460|nr:tryptophan--tRNA ligase [Parvivirga hydrogeniphila]MCL4079043.1 tryptophan--tRNA ligase [Parvivirga hydrogeniphila]